jgi:IS5 family transposase
MRLIQRLQLFLRPAKVETKQSDELEEIARILDQAPGMREIYAEVLKEVAHGKCEKTGRGGLTAEQIVRLGILRARSGATYRELEHMTADSLSVQAFLNIAPGVGIKKSSINSNLKCVSEATWRKINDCIKVVALRDGMEDGKALRGDTTTTKTNIHHPTDASLLVDGIRVLTRPMNRLKAWCGVELESSDHYRRAKSKLYKINNTRKARVRRECYLELIRVARMTLGYAENSVEILKTFKSVELDSLPRLIALEWELKHYIPLVKQVIDQAHRRIAYGENVPVSEKIFSIFEPETDIIIKGQRDIVFGHKLFLTTGKSSLIFHVSTLDGNPSDSSLVEQSLKEHKRFYNYAPDDVAFDGGFASTANRDIAKAEGVKNITFSKNGTMPLETLVSSKKKQKMLLRFRAGIEGCISFFKRIFGATKILDRTKETFKAVLQCGAVAYNLTLLARFRLRQAAT